jgi:hypothetical protein
MVSKKLAALVAASLLVGTAPAAAQPALSLSPSVALDRAGATLEEENDLAGGLLVAILGIGVVAGAVLAFTDDSDEDLPDSN